MEATYRRVERIYILFGWLVLCNHGNMWWIWGRGRNHSNKPCDIVMKDTSGRSMQSQCKARQRWEKK